MSAPCLMVFGTASDSGKSTIVAALCRAFVREGVSVAPFKAQNMARNAYVCADGGEIGVAQAVQAFAARVQPSIDHNPILLKPEPGLRSQLIVLGKSWGTRSWADTHTLRPSLMAALEGALGRLRAAHELVILEGAGSPAEVNLQARDLPNLAAARAADAEIVLVADIDRGGMFASVLGTLELLPADLRPRVRGLIINKFRGEVSLLEPGLAFLRERTGVPVLGVVPFLDGTGLPDEDSLALARHRGGVRAGLDELEVAVIDMPCLANFEDVLPLGDEPGVRLRLTAAARELLEADLVVIAGSKNTVHDLTFLRDHGLDVALARRAARGEPIVGICGGAQMLGQRIDDPEGIESKEASVPALGLLPHHTRYASPKQTRQVRGQLQWGSGLARRVGWVDGFELHHGRLVLAEVDDASCALRLEDGQPEGCQRNGVLATMVHRVFDQPAARAALLDDLRARRGLQPPMAARLSVDCYDRLTDHVQSALDWQAMRRIALRDRP